MQPFAPFCKGDRVGRACEWNYTRDRERNRHWQRNAGFGKEGEPSPFVMEQVDEEGFHLVEQKTPAKPKWGPGARGRGGRGGMRCVLCIQSVTSLHDCMQEGNRRILLHVENLIAAERLIVSCAHF